MKTLFRHVPNFLTVLRLAAVPVFYVLMMDDKRTAAIWVFLLNSPMFSTVLSQGNSIL